MKAIEHFETLEKIINAIQKSVYGESVPYFGGTYTGDAETLAAEYAAKAVADDSPDPLREAEAHLDTIYEETGGGFDYEKAADLARKLLIRRMLEDASQELGEDAAIAKVVAHAAGEDGTVFTVVEGGDHTDPIRLDDLAEAAGATMECARRHWVEDDRFGGHYELEPIPCSQIDSHTAIRYVFSDGSAIVVMGDAWDIEGNEPFTWEGA